VSKKRLDILLQERGLVRCRNRAKTEIMSGKVLVDGQKCDKPGTPVSQHSEVRLLSPSHSYVSRGGLKLAGAWAQLGFSVKNKIIIDIGASTGGFTHFTLLNGARKIYAVDVGYGQLDWSLRQDPRVIPMEKTNARYLHQDDFSLELLDMGLVDVSFISLKKIIPVLRQLQVAEIITLVKPQFEAGKNKVGKKGVVKSRQVHREVLADLARFLRDYGYLEKGITFSPVKGPRGNLEFFFYAVSSDAGDAGGSHTENLEEYTAKVVEEAWSYFGAG